MAKNTIDYGDQTRSINYYDDLRSSLVNSRNKAILPPGIYSGGFLTVNDATSVTISPLICEIGDGTYTIGIETAVNRNIEVTHLTPYIILRWAYYDAIDNYLEMLSVAESGVLSTDLVVGKGTFSGATLIGFDYQDSLHPRNQAINFINSLQVVQTPTASTSIYINTGRITFGSTVFTISTQTLLTLLAIPSAARYDLIVINSAGAIEIITGTDDGDIPSCEYKAPLASIKLEIGSTVITDAMITDQRCYNNVPADPSLVSVYYTSQSILAGEEITIYDAVYIKSDGKVWKANRDTSTKALCVGIALAGASVDALCEIIFHGPVTNTGWLWTAGDPIYLDDSDGGLTQSIPGSGILMRVGSAIGTTTLLCNPDNSYITY